jgi:hypothetical protein
MKTLNNNLKEKEIINSFFGFNVFKSEKSSVKDVVREISEHVKK